MNTKQVFIRDLGKNLIISSGQILSRVRADKNINKETKKYGTIISKTIGKGYLIDEEICNNEYTTNINEKNFTKEGDIIIKNSLPCNAVLIDKQHEGLLVSSLCSIIRGVELIDKEYFVVYLNSRYFQDQIIENISRSTMSVLSNSKLQELEIPVYSIEFQKEIVKQFEKISKEEKLFDRILKLENEKLNLLIGGDL